MKFIKYLLPLALFISCHRVPEGPTLNSTSPFSAIEVLTSRNDTFEKATQIRPFAFPRDHFAHPDFKTEWWYWTGHLKNEDQQEFGYQLTFFRSSNTRPLRLLPWNSSETWMAHFAVGNATEKKFVFFERFERGTSIDSPAKADLALAGSDPYSKMIFVHGWKAKILALDPLSFELSAKGTNGTAIQLQLTAEKPIVLQGDQGLSWKNKEKTNASYYYSSTRLRSQGTLVFEGQQMSVKGHSWLDREWSSGSLSREQTGWDWFSLQMDDGSDVMLFQIRGKTPATNFRTGKLISRNGETSSLDPMNVVLKPESEWVSATNTRYPASWTVQWESGKRYVVKPVFPDQELRLKFKYWEGAVHVETQEGKKVGQGFLEMTGY